GGGAAGPRALPVLAAAAAFRGASRIAAPRPRGDSRPKAGAWRGGGALEGETSLRGGEIAREPRPGGGAARRRGRGRPRSPPAHGVGAPALLRGRLPSLWRLQRVSRRPRAAVPLLGRGGGGASRRAPRLARADSGPLLRPGRGGARTARGGQRPAGGLGLDRGEGAEDGRGASGSFPPCGGW